MMNVKKYSWIAVFVFSLLWSHSCTRPGEDTEGWVRWRGPTGDGTIQTESFNPHFPENESSEVWHREYREGFSSMTVTSMVLTVPRIIDSAAISNASIPLPAKRSGAKNFGPMHL